MERVLLGMGCLLGVANALADGPAPFGPPAPGSIWAPPAPVSAPTPSPSPSPALGEPGSIPSLLKPEIAKRVLDREIMDHASLDDAPESTGQPSLGMSIYSYYIAMSVDTDVHQARKVLTDYSLYAKMIPYVDSAKFDAKTHILELEGGIWKFKLKSWVRFDEKSERWIHYRIVGGHFTGLEGDILFEPQPEKKQATLVYMRGALTAAHWPPKFVIEEGAQIVFGFTASHMRSYLESQASGGQEDHGGEIPQPRNHL